eukprot:COSAG01_NODE_2658_length_7302_cov_4.298626_5_plen_105_part_00
MRAHGVRGSVLAPTATLSVLSDDDSDEMTVSGRYDSQSDGDLGGDLGRSAEEDIREPATAFAPAPVVPQPAARAPGTGVDRAMTAVVAAAAAHAGGGGGEIFIS